MTALEILGLITIILVCMSLPVTLIIDVYNENPKRNKHGKILPKPNVPVYEYVIVFYPCYLAAIILFANEYNEKLLSLIILGIGYAVLILFAYGMRIAIPKVSLLLLLSSLIIAFTGVYTKSRGITFYLYAQKDLTMAFYFPLITYIYLIVSRRIIFQLTNTYPILTSRYTPVGYFYRRYKRRVNYWDGLWTFFNAILFLAALFLMFKWAYAGNNDGLAIMGKATKALKKFF